MQTTAQNPHKKKQKTTAINTAQPHNFLSWVFTKNHAPKPSFMRLLLFLSELLIHQLSFFSFFFGKYFKQKTITMSNANNHIQTGNGSENFY